MQGQMFASSIRWPWNLKSNVNYLTCWSFLKVTFNGSFVPPTFSSQILLSRTVKQPFVLLLYTLTHTQDTYWNFIINVLVKLWVCKCATRGSKTFWNSLQRSPIHRSTQSISWTALQLFTISRCGKFFFFKEQIWEIGKGYGKTTSPV